MLTIRIIIYFLHGIHWWRYEKFEDTKVVIRSVNQKRKDNAMTERFVLKGQQEGQTTIYKTLHRKLKVEQPEPH